MKWTVKEVLHSGRKGERGTPCNDSKYESILGWNVYFNIDDIQRLKELRMYLKGHLDYDWWDTSAVLAASITDGNVLNIETENTIYILQGE